MDFSHYSDEPVRMAAALINSIDVVTGEDELRTPEGRRDLHQRLERRLVRR